METAYEVLVKEQPSQFEIHAGGEIAFMEYRYHKEDIVLMHTFVPDTLRGKNIAGQLAAFAFAYAREKKLKTVVYCPFVQQYLKRHPEYADLVRKQ